MKHTLQMSGINMHRADSELMAADIFTKPFPETKRSIWDANLKLISIYPSNTVDKDIIYTADKAYSLRGDMSSLRMQKIVPEPLEIEFDVEGGSSPIAETNAPSKQTAKAGG